MSTPITYARKINFTFREQESDKRKYIDNRDGCPMNFFGYVIKGHCRIVSEKKTLVVREHELFYIPEDLSYESYWAPNDGKLAHLSFGFHELNADDVAKYELQKIACDDRIRSMLFDIPLGSPITCAALSRFYRFLAAVFPIMEREVLDKECAIVEAAKRYIAANPNCSVPDIAKACFISEPYLYLLFRKVLGMTPNDYRQSVLCQIGINLLNTTTKSVEEISEILGFSSCSYFRKILKKHTGCTPRDIRKNNAI